MFRNILLVARRDFLAVVRTKGFLIGLVFLPAVITVSSQLPKLWERFGERGERRFAVADFTGQLAAPLDERIAMRDAEPGRKVTVKLDHFDLAAHGIPPGDYAAAKEKLKEDFARRARADELYGFVLIGPRVLEIPATAPEADADRRGAAPDDKNIDGSDDDKRGSKAAAEEDAGIVYGARSLTAGDVGDVVRGAVYDAVRTLRLASRNVDSELVRRIDAKPTIEQRIIGKREGELETASGASEGMAAMGVVFLILLGVMQSAGLLLNSTIEEKSNRVVEVLVSSIRPFELLAGKIVGAWLVGLVMLLAWGCAGFFAANQALGVRASIFSGPNIAWFAFFFLFGYLLFASLYAAVGAMCSSIQDAQSLMFPIVILIMIPMLSLGPVMQHPDSVLSQILTYFPFSAPFIASLRLALSPPPPQWQIWIAAVSVGVGAWILMWLGGKVFRIAIFSTGKPPRPGEIWRWLREA